ncbi:cytidine deaminase-like protein [Mrakia frigida]|uniref:deoxycytidine monophosphate deaminase n=1 Tax=Mrakia frigida TaxID=29902 RepID=UPI003FCBF0AA
MFIALVGLPLSGKDAIADWLVKNKDFTRVSIDQDDQPIASSSTSPSSPPLAFPSALSLLNNATKSWRTNLVTTDLQTTDDLEEFLKRPFFLLVGVEAGALVRWDRFPASPSPPTALHDLFALANLRIVNNFTSLEDLYGHLEDLNLENTERVRPSWDNYFMTLASLASLRSNCMKRRVGAILVREKRIVSTGYNGTPRGMRNCNEGGCGRCNRGEARGGGLNLCVCLHAEENALLEAGRERVGLTATLYCNTCPCLPCAVKIVQSGVKEVVYNLAYAMDEESARVLKEGGVELRRWKGAP